MTCSEHTDEDEDLEEEDAVAPTKITRTPEQEMEDFVARGQVGWDADLLRVETHSLVLPPCNHRSIHIYAIKGIVGPSMCVCAHQVLFPDWPVSSLKVRFPICVIIFYHYHY